MHIHRSPIAAIQESHTPEMSHNRLLVMMIAFAFAFLVVAFRLCEVALFSDTDAVASRRASGEEGATFKRQDIIDRNGVLLAVNLSTASLYAIPKIIENPKEATDKLHAVLPELPYKKLLADLSSKKSFIWIKRNLTPKEEYAVNNLGIPGLQFERGAKRIYPHGALLSHVLGYVGIDGKGLAGVEKQFNNELAAVDADEIKPSKPLQLSIDVRVQSILHEELSKAFQEFRPIGGVALVADVHNGEVLGMTSLPDFDPHSPGSAKAEELFNRATLGVYEMGSSFKTFTMAIGLDTHKISLRDSFDVNSPIKAARFSIGDYHAKGGTLSVPEIFMYSSNIGTAKIGLEVGGKIQREFLRKFGLMGPLDIELPEKALPMYPSESRWGDISTMTISYGHGIAVTPVHVVRAMIGLVNGGTMYPVTLLKHDDIAQPKGVRIVSPDTSDKIRRLLRLVVTSGTGKKAEVAGYLVGGKTGTSEKLSGGGSYSKHTNLSSFVGAFPINDPHYVVLVILDEPKGTKATGGYSTGGMTAAPVVKQIVARMGPLYGMQPVDENAQEVQREMQIDFKAAGDKLASY